MRCTPPVRRSSLLKLNCNLSNLIRSGQHRDALHLFHEIHNQHLTIKPDHYTISTALTACARLRAIVFGTQLHAYALRSGLKSYSHVSNTILSLYAETKCLGSSKKVFEEIMDPDAYSLTAVLSACAKLGDFEYAWKVFEEMPEKDVAVWNAMITGFVKNGSGENGIYLFKKMHTMGVRHDKYSFASVLKECSSWLVDLGKEVHSLVIKTGFLVRPSVVNSLITMYFNCKYYADACLVFEETANSVRDQITFNAMIEGLASSGRVEEGLLVFIEMLDSCLKPTESTFVSLMSSCSCARIGCQVVGQAVKTGFEGCTSVSNAAMEMYSKFGDLNAAYTIFNRLEEKDTVSWNTIISSYGQGKLDRLAILAYQEMQRAGIKPDEFTYGNLMASTEFVEILEFIQALVYKNGLISKTEVSNALVSAYSKLGKVDHACKIFRFSLKNLISWNGIISGFLINGFPMQALEQFSNLLVSNMEPNAYTLSIVLSICTNISSLRLGKEIHGYIIRNKHDLEASLGNALITMYAKCGVINWSLEVFNKMSEKDVVSWNALLSAYAQHGEGEEAVLAFNRMQDEGEVKPDQATFTSLLSACSHAGLVDDGTRIFNAMVTDYGIIPGVDHFSCIVDLLARAGYLDEAENVINSRNIQGQANVWWGLFSACAAHGNLKLGRTIAWLLLEQEKDSPSIYVLLSNIYAAAGQWKEAAYIRELMQSDGISKQHGCSWIRS